MSKTPATDLSRRERQIMDIVYRRGRATAAEVRSCLADPPSNSAVRALLAILVQKGRLKIEEDGPRYVYEPTRPRHEAGRSAIRRVVETFFEGSTESAVAALLDAREITLSNEQTTRLKALIDHARKGGR
ncbi:MAG: BlaI/MecI/CopY family transcriptional regulator [Opitutales bacterium]|jgi:predicted transcriptional regulator